MGKEDLESAPLYYVSATKLIKRSGRGVAYSSNFGEGSTPDEALVNAWIKARRLIEEGRAEGKDFGFDFSEVKVSLSPEPASSENLVTVTSENHDQQS